MRVALGILNGALFAVYPFAVYFGLTRLSARGVGLVLAGLLLPSLLLRVRGTKREHLSAVLPLPLTVLALVLIGAAFDDARLVMSLPVVISTVLLLHFGGSLRSVPIVERFARMQSESLSAAQVRYCRTVTMVWCVFFVLNGSTAALLALFAPLAVWAAYTGAGAYVLMGLLGATEYIVRKARFREFGAGFHDRLLARIFPPRVTDASVL